MRLPADRLITKRRKLTEYLLVRQDKSDKSRFLERCGYTLDNVEALEEAIRELVAANDATPDFGDAFGQRFKVTGQLPVLVGRDVICWLQGLDSPGGGNRYVAFRDAVSGRPVT